jgi:signal transduction histidine kinase
MDAVMTTVFRADGSIVLQNPAAVSGFAAPSDAAGLSPFLRHFADPAEGAALLDRLMAGQTVRSVVPVHTGSGIRCLRFVASPMDCADRNERQILLVETEIGPTLQSDGEQRLRDYAEAAADCFWEMDAALRFVSMSQSTQLPVSDTHHLFVGQKLIDLAEHGEDGDDIRALSNLLAARLPFRDIRISGRDGDGVAHHLSLSGLPIFEGRGQFAGYRGIGRDVTLLMRAERYAEIAQSRLIDAIEAIPECFMLLDADDRLLLCNSRYREVNEAIGPWLVTGMPLADIYAASEDRGAVRPAATSLEARFQPGLPGVGESRLGSRWFQISEKRTDDGGSVVIQTEITTIKRRERELAEQSKILGATLQNMRQGLLVLDEQLTVTLWNDQLCEIVNLPSELLRVGVPVTDLIRAQAELGLYGSGDPDEIVEKRLDAMRAMPPIEELFREDGRVIERRISPMPDGGLVATYLDITDRKSVEDDLRRAKEEAEMGSRTKTEFLANMSHELRTPLNAIIGFSEILHGQVFGTIGDPRYCEYAADIRDSGQHLLNLINDLLDVSKVEFGKVELSEDTVDLAPIIEASRRLMRDRAEEAGIALTVEVPRDMPYLLVDARRIKQIILNLMSNAVKFTPGGGRVSVRVVSHDNGEVSLSVADTGIGIAPQNLETALRPFGQIDSHLSRKFEGSGLGLPLTKSMIELHGGRLTLESEIGRGTVATIWVPAMRVMRPDSGAQDLWPFAANESPGN